MSTVMYRTVLTHSGVSQQGVDTYAIVHQHVASARSSSAPRLEPSRAPGVARRALTTDTPREQEPSLTEANLDYAAIMTRQQGA